MVEPDDSIDAVKAHIQEEKEIPFKKRKAIEWRWGSNVRLKESYIC